MAISNEELISLALEARLRAYAPYSDWLVGAALLTKDGRIYQGCNIENGGFTATNCAERTAFFKAIYDGVYDFSKIAIVGGDRKQGVIGYCAPCGVCRQVMAEFCDPDDFIIIIGKENGEYKEFTLRQMLPENNFIREDNSFGFKPNK